MVYNEKNLQDQKTIYKLQKIIVVMFILILALCYKIHDLKTYYEGYILQYEKEYIMGNSKN